MLLLHHLNALFPNLRNRQTCSCQMLKNGHSDGVRVVSTVSRLVGILLGGPQLFGTIDVEGITGGNVARSEYTTACARAMRYPKMPIVPGFRHRAQKPQ